MCGWAMTQLSGHAAPTWAYRQIAVKSRVLSQRAGGPAAFFLQIVDMFVLLKLHFFLTKNASGYNPAPADTPLVLRTDSSHDRFLAS